MKLSQQIQERKRIVITELANLVKNKEISGYRIAKDLGYDKSHIYKIVNGDRSPSVEVMEEIEEYIEDFKKNKKS